MVEGIVAIVLVVGVMVLLYASGWADGRDAERAKLRAQMQALGSSLRLAEAECEARQQLRDAATDHARRNSDSR